MKVKTKTLDSISRLWIINLISSDKRKHNILSIISNRFNWLPNIRGFRTWQWNRLKLKFWISNSLSQHSIWKINLVWSPNRTLRTIWNIICLQNTGLIHAFFKIHYNMRPRMLRIKSCKQDKYQYELLQFHVYWWGIVRVKLLE